VLRLANSAFYGVPGRVCSIGDAIQLLGRRTVSAVITTAAVSAQIKPGDCAGFDHGGFWRHTMGTAIAAQQIARLLALDEDMAFTAGLMHDMGRLALAAYYATPFAAAIAAQRATDGELLQAERDVLGVDHAAVGALLAEQWHFPPDVTRAIAEHHDLPGVEAGHGRPTMAEIVHVADAVVHALDLAGDPQEAVPPVHPRSWQRMAITPAQYAQLFEHTERGVAALGQVLAL
jgi:putative nucleotidyltransferase with HDIG domain